MAAFSFDTCFVLKVKYWESVSILAEPGDVHGKQSEAYHLPELVRPGKLFAGSFHDEGLLLGSAMLQLELDVSQPWLRVARVAEDILLIDGVFVALRCAVSYAGWF